MQAEIDAQETLREVRILGVNGIGLESGNVGMTVGHVLPWLQPAGGEDVWTLWEVVFRDVVILGPGNERLDTFNLTVNNLGETASYDILKDMLLEAANEE